MDNYKDIFEKVEKVLREKSSFSDSEFDKIYGRFKVFENKNRSDRDFFEMLVMIIFYSGFRASTVEDREITILKYLSDFNEISQYTDIQVEEIAVDSKMIGNRKKIKACIENAKTFKKIVEKYGSFQNYIDKFDANSSFENLLLLKEELQCLFEFLGGITVFHFLTDMGFDVLKPDRVILRVFKRLGLIECEKQLLKAIIQGRIFAKETGLAIRYIDIIFVKYGQQGKSEMFGLKDGICLENNPKCSICEVTQYCEYFKNK